MEAKECEELVKVVVDILQVTIECLGLDRATGLQRKKLEEKKFSFVRKICNGSGFAFIRLTPEVALCFRRSTDKGEIFFLAGQLDQCDEEELEGWQKRVKEAFAGLKYEFEARQVLDLDAHLSTMERIFGDQPTGGQLKL